MPTQRSKCSFEFYRTLLTSPSVKRNKLVKLKYEFRPKSSRGMNNFDYNCTLTSTESVAKIFMSLKVFYDLSFNKHKLSWKNLDFIQ